MMHAVGSWLYTVWLIVRKAPRRVLRFRKASLFGLAASILLMMGAVDYECYLAGSDRPIDAYPALALDGYHRLLVLAPHCDDETLGAGGLIREALRRGMDVRVVIATAGDAYTRCSACRDSHAAPHHSELYRRVHQTNLSGHAYIAAHGHAHIAAHGHAYIAAHGHAHIVAHGHAYIVAHGHAYIAAHGHAYIVAHAAAHGHDTRSANPRPSGQITL